MILAIASTALSLAALVIATRGTGSAIARKARSECAELAEEVENMRELHQKRARRENVAKARESRLTSYDEADAAAQRVLDLAARPETNFGGRPRETPNERMAAREEARQRGLLQ